MIQIQKVFCVNCLVLGIANQKKKSKERNNSWEIFCIFRMVWIKVIGLKIIFNAFSVFVYLCDLVILDSDDADCECRCCEMRQCLRKILNCTKIRERLIVDIVWWSVGARLKANKFFRLINKHFLIGFLPYCSSVFCVEEFPNNEKRQEQQQRVTFSIFARWSSEILNWNIMLWNGEVKKC